MSTVVRIERVEHYIEWAVQLPAAAAEIEKARTAAFAEAQEQGIDVRWDDWAIVDHDDTHLIFRLRVDNIKSAGER